MARKTAHEEGYSDFVRMGLSARNPYRPDEKGHDGWQRGFCKAAHRYGSATPARSEERRAGE